MTHCLQRAVYSKRPVENATHRDGVKVTPGRYWGQARLGARRGPPPDDVSHRTDPNCEPSGFQSVEEPFPRRLVGRRTAKDGPTVPGLLVEGAELRISFEIGTEAVALDFDKPCFGSQGDVVCSGGGLDTYEGPR
jgi:hypothetical protein